MAENKNELLDLGTEYSSSVSRIVKAQRRAELDKSVDSDTLKEFVTDRSSDHTPRVLEEDPFSELMGTSTAVQHKK